MKFHWSRALGFFRQGTSHNFAQHGVFEHAARKKQVSKVALV
jgi:hypothetical protein